MEIIIIAAKSKNGVIGNNGKMPWYSKEESNFFKETTLGSPVIMGRKTFESLVSPLSGRQNIILSKNDSLKIPQDCIKFSSIQYALEYCKNSEFKKCFIIGGGEIFEQFLHLADKMIISEMKFDGNGDVYFPIIVEENWNRTESKPVTDFIVNYYTKVKS